MEDLSKLSELLAFPKEIVLLSHRNPDGDAIGSCLALSLYLQGKGHKTSVLFPSEYPLAFEWMPQSEEIIIYDLTPSVAENSIRNAKYIFCRFDLYNLYTYNNIRFSCHHDGSRLCRQLRGGNLYRLQGPRFGCE